MKYSFAAIALISILTATACHDRGAAGVAKVPIAQPGVAPFFETGREANANIVAVIREKSCACDAIERCDCKR